MDSLKNCALEYLHRTGCAFRSTPDKTIHLFSMRGHFGSYPVYLYTKAPYLICLAKYPQIVPDEHRMEVAEFLHRINYGLLLGNFEMDLDDGILRFRTALISDSDEIPHSILAQYIQMPAAMLDRYAAGIDAMIYEGELALNALKLIED